MASTKNGDSNSHTTLNYLISPQLLDHYRNNILSQCHQTSIRRHDFLPHYRARSYPLYIGENFIKISNESQRDSNSNNNTPNSSISSLDNECLSHHQSNAIITDYIVNENTAHKYSKVTDAFALESDDCICGEGTYGVVFRAYSKPRGKDVAVKGIRCDDGYTYQLDEKEDTNTDTNNTDTKTDNNHNSNSMNDITNTQKTKINNDKKAGIRQFMTSKLALKKKNRLFNDQVGIPHTAIQELQTLQRLQHKNIVNLIDVVSNRTFDCVPCDVSSSHYLKLLRLIWNNDKRPYRKKYRQVALPDLPIDQDEEKSRKIITWIFSEIGQHDARALESDIRDILYSKSEEIHQKRCSSGIKPVPVFYMTFEYMDRDLAKLLKKLHDKHTTMKVSVAKYLFKQIMEGLRHCHQCGIIHRDIKPSNVLINYSGEVKLCDFGLAFENNSTHSSTIKSNRVVTSWYRPPEILLGETKYSYAIDIWSCVCVLVEMLTGTSPFQGQSELDLFRQICNLCGKPEHNNWPNVDKLPWYTSMMQHLNKSKPGVIEEKNAIFYRYKRCITTDPFLMHHINDNGLHFLDFMLVLNPEERPTSEEVLCHPYFRYKPLPTYVPIDDPYKIDVEQIQKAIEKSPEEKEKENKRNNPIVDKTMELNRNKYASSSLSALHPIGSNQKGSKNKYQYPYKYNDWNNDHQTMYNNRNGYNNNNTQSANYQNYENYNPNNYSNGYNQNNYNRNNNNNNNNSSYRQNYNSNHRDHGNNREYRKRYNSNRGHSSRGNRRGRGGYNRYNRESVSNRDNHRRNTSRYRRSSESPSTKRHSLTHHRQRSRSRSRSRSISRSKSKSNSRQRTISRTRSKSRSKSKSRQRSTPSRSRSRSRQRSNRSRS